jgi:hypothetical protein
MYIKIVKNIKSNYTGYMNLLNYYSKFNNSTDHDIRLDFSDVKQFDLNLFAVLSAICTTFSEKDYKITLFKLSEGLRRKLQEHKFPDVQLSETYDDKNIGYKKFESTQLLEFSNYIDLQVLSYPEFPSMSKQLKQKMNDSLGEVFGNVNMHTEAKEVFCCGQIFPSTHRLDFTIVNLGKTIKQNVNEFFNLTNSVYTGNTIAWAVENEHSTKLDKTGGFGLAILSDFVKINNGKLQIISDNEFWELGRNNEETKSNFFNNAFNGTIVNIEFNTNDNASYVLNSEINENNLF